MSAIHLVIEEEGEYSERRVRIVRAFSDEAKARALVDAEMAKARVETAAAFERANQRDPANIGYRARILAQEGYDRRYYIEAVELEA